MVNCAEQGECTVEEMDRMIQGTAWAATTFVGRNGDSSYSVSLITSVFSLELEKKNEESKKVLKQALMLQRELASLKGVLRDMVDTVEERTKSVRDTEDHSFQHFVDYKGIGAYESHW